MMPRLKTTVRKSSAHSGTPTTKLSDLVEAAHDAGMKVSIGLVPKEGYTALHPSFRHKVWYGFRDGASTLRLRRKYSLTQSVIEQIIRDQMKAPNAAPSHAEKNL